VASGGFERVLLGPLDSIRRAIEILQAGSIQIAFVVDEDRVLLGAVTDGDVRRGLLRGIGLNGPVAEVMNIEPVSAAFGTPSDKILDLMTARIVKQVPLLDPEHRIVGLELLDHLRRGPTEKDNPVVILAGGLGTRLHPLTVDTPKPLLKVGGQPLLELIVQRMHASGFRKLYISVNHMADRIEQFFGDGSRHGMTISYLKESKPLGTAGPLSLLPVSIDLPCIVMNGDLLTKVGFESMLEFHREGEFDLTIGVKEYPFQVPFGVVVTSEDRVLEFQEKPMETRTINAGVYVLSPDVIRTVPANDHYDMNQLIESQLSQPSRKVGAFLIHEYWTDIGTAADYQQAEWDFHAQFGDPSKQPKS
jgi:dTDP-glucose pyrophosphorylase